MRLIEVDRDGFVASLTLNRPDQRNALSLAMCDEIVEALAVIERSDARAILLRGAGKVFCAGADFAAVSGSRGLEFLRAFERMLSALTSHRLPTVAAIHGAALGGGLQLAVACDFRVAAEDAVLGIPSSRLGIVVDYDNVRRLVLLAGVARSKEILMGARTFSGGEAARAGLVTEAVAADDVVDEARALTARLAALAPLAVQGVKHVVDAVAARIGDVRGRDPDALAELDRLLAEAYSSDDLQEGLRAVSEKRPPKFRGR